MAHWDNQVLHKFLADTEGELFMEGAPVYTPFLAGGGRCAIWLSEDVKSFKRFKFPSVEKMGSFMEAYGEELQVSLTAWAVVDNTLVYRPGEGFFTAKTEPFMEVK